MDKLLGEVLTNVAPGLVCAVSVARSGRGLMKHTLTRDTVATAFATLSTGYPDDLMKDAVDATGVKKILK